MIKRIKTIDLGGVNCYLLETQVGFVLIDTGGCTFSNPRLSEIRSKLDSNLKAAGCVPGRLKLVILTHGDYDHSGNCAYIQERFQVPVAMHVHDSELVENPSWSNMVEDSHFRKKSVAIVVKLITTFNGSKIRKTIEEFERFKPDLYVDESTELSQFGLDAKILHTPGHTRGSIGNMTSNGDFFSGDMLANMRKPSIAPNAYDFDLMTSSINKLKKLQINMVYPGHGKPFPISELQQC